MEMMTYTFLHNAPISLCNNSIITELLPPSRENARERQKTRDPSRSLNDFLKVPLETQESLSSYIGRYLCESLKVKRKWYIYCPRGTSATFSANYTFISLLRIRPVKTFYFQRKEREWTRGRQRRREEKKLDEKVNHKAVRFLFEPPTINKLFCKYTQHTPVWAL